MRIKISPWLITVATLALLSSEVSGQEPDLEKLRSYIERNQAMLLEAGILVRGTNSAKARASLETARNLHLTSVRELESNRPVLAARAAQQARNAILRSIQLAKRETKLEERALKAIDHAQRRNEVARNLLDEAGSGDAGAADKLVQESSNQLARAQGNMREHMFEVAIQSANASTDMSNRAIKLLKRDSVGPELVVKEIARTDQLLDRLDERADRVGNPELSRMITEAHELQERARDESSNGRYLLAFEHTKRARAIARRIINRSGGLTESNADAVARAIELTDGLLDRAYEIARDAGEKKAIRQLDEATRIQQDARDAYRTGHHDRALRLTRRARDMARNTMRGRDRTVDAGAVRRALERTDMTISRLGSMLDAGGGGSASDLYDRATARQASAWDAFNAGNFNKALANTKVARNLANRALQQMENG